MRSYFRWCGVFGALALFLGTILTASKQASPILPPQATPPNILLIFVDDLGWADLSSYGSQYYETPNLDRLAAGGVKFTDAYAAAAICSPSRSALMTGKYPARTGITDWIRASFQNASAEYDGKNKKEYERDQQQKLIVPAIPFELPLSEKTTAEYLKEQGYFTGFVGKWHLGMEDYYPEKQGFDVNIGGCDFGQPPSYFDPYANASVKGIPTLPARKAGEYLTDREADEVIQLIRKNKGKPFFINYAPYAVHTPLGGKPELVEKYKAKTPTEQKNPVYAAMVESMDATVGKILAELEAQKLLENTLVIFTSDNGGLLGNPNNPITSNPPFRSGKGYPYEGGIRVPLIVSWPGNIAPRVSASPVITMDIFNTILDAAGTRPDRSIPNDGVSLLNHLTKGQPLPTRDLFWHFPHYRYEDVTPYSIVRSGYWKLIHHYEDGSDELYNLKEDFAETRNLADELPQKRNELRKKLDAFLARTEAKVPVRR
jgi:arylsulfatase A